MTLLAAWDIEKWPAPRIIQAQDIPAFLQQYPPEETFSVSHNALFDAAILAWKYGWVPARMADTLGTARALRTFDRYSLGAVAKGLFGYDPKGDVIHKCKGLDIQGIKNAGLWGDYCTYAMNDVRICAQIFIRLYPEFPRAERRIQDLVLRAAIEPVLHADVKLLTAHLETIRAEKARLLVACGYDKAALMSTSQFKSALESLGVVVETKPSHAKADMQIPALAKTDWFMQELLEHADIRVQTLAAARLSHRSTIEETRAQRFLNVAQLPWVKLEIDPTDPDEERAFVTNPHLLPVPLRYGAAHTHRLGGEWSMNMQNLPRDKTRSRLRSALLAPPGHKLIVCDLSQIEARIVACLCGEDGLRLTFAAGEDVYATFASVVFGRKINKNDQPFERFIGKTAILGLGYGCGAPKFYKMVVTSARQAGIPLDTNAFNEDHAVKVVQIYRTLMPGIPRTWSRLDFLWRNFISNKLDTQSQDFGPVTCRSGKIVLPNSLTLRYTRGDASIWGGKLLENVTQALARIVVMDAALRLAGRGYRFVLQAHDELVFAVPEPQVEHAKAVILEEMVRPPAWMLDLPLAAEVGVGVNYGECK